MQSSKAISGTLNVECLTFPCFSTNKELLKDKTCHVIEPYDDGELLSVFILKDENGGSIIKILDKNGIHLDPNNVKSIEKEIRVVLHIGLTLGIKQSQLFFSVKNNEAALVDVFDGKTFISPGMLSDIYGKRVKIQTTKSVEKYDPDKKYDAIIKPKITCFDNGSPVYVKG